MRWILAVAAVVLLAGLLVAFLPMRWVTDRYVPDLKADAVEGSVWDARFSNARFQNFPLGDIATGLSFQDLLGGRATLGFRKVDEAVAGRFYATRTTRGVEQLNGRFVLPVLPAPLPPVRLAIRDASVALDAAGQCQSAAGRVSASIDDIPRIGPVPLLEGEARCDGPDLLLPMEAPNGVAMLGVRVMPGGRWVADLGVPAGNAMRAAVLGLMGFRLVDGMMMWTVAGSGAEVLAAG